MSPETPKKAANRARPARAGESFSSARPEKNVKRKRILQHRKAKNKGGRPPAITEAQVQLLVAAFMNDYTNAEALQAAKVAKSTYHATYNRDAAFRDRIDGAQQYALTLAKRTMIKQIKDGDGNLALRLLERRQPDRYRTKVEGDPPPPPVTVILPGTKAHPRFTPPAKQ